MDSTPNRPRYRVVTLMAWIAGSFAMPMPAAELMPPAEQNALIQKYCAVCHTDAAKNGGLSLQHFDAAQAPPSLTAMLLSKLTGGVSVKTAREALSDANTAAFVDRKMGSGAMNAAGVPMPDKAVMRALLRAFIVQSANATEWAIEQQKGDVVTASILRETSGPTDEVEAESYRLIASCNLATQEGTVQLTWSPVPRSGSLGASVDGKASVRYRVEGTERMGNASLILDLPLPAESLAITGLFPGQTVTFPFSGLPRDAREKLGRCFRGPAKK